MSEASSVVVIELEGLFDVGPPIGRGQFGTVSPATHRLSGCTVALKACDKCSLQVSDPKTLHRVRQEARVLQYKLGHANVVRCFGLVETVDVISIVLSLEPGESLAAFVSRNGALEEVTAAPAVLQVARALRHCHERKVCHRDVKLDNVMYDSTSGRAVLVDFGLALVQRTKVARLDVRCGSAEYSAPEMVDPRSKGYHGPAVDAWAFGVLVYVCTPPSRAACRHGASPSHARASLVEEPIF